MENDDKRIVHEEPSSPDEHVGFIDSLARQMIPEVANARVEQCHEDGLERLWGKIQGRLWLHGAEPDTLALIKGFHYRRSREAHEVISSQQFRVVTALDVVDHAMSKDLSLKDLVDGCRVLVLRVQNDAYPSTVCSMILQALRLRHSVAADKTTWLVTDSRLPQCLVDKAGWGALQSFLEAAFPIARASEGSAPKSLPKADPNLVRSTDRKGNPVPWNCAVCRKRYEASLTFRWADAVGVLPDKGKKVCQECYDQFLQSSVPVP